MNLSQYLQRDWTPTTPSDLCGPARTAAIVIDKLIARSMADNHAPIKVSLMGPPGTGKSTLVKYLKRRLNIGQFDHLNYAGGDVDIERVRELEQSLQYQPTGPYRLVQIEEADGMSPAALKRMLPLLDNLPRRTVVALTSNKSLEQTEERFHSRFKILEVTGPTIEETFNFLLEKLRTQNSELSPQVVHLAKEIARLANGNVRQAIDDLDTALLTQS